MLSETAFIQLAIALTGALIAFVVGSMGYARNFFYLLIVFLPFEPLSSQYGSANVGLIYLLGASVFLNRNIVKPKIPRLRMVWFACGILLVVYIVGFILRANPLKIHKAAYIIDLGSNVVLLYMLSVFVRTQEDFRKIVNLVMITNVLVVIYCVVMLVAGHTNIVPFGIQEFAFAANRADSRLVGPFSGVGVLAEYLVLMIYFMAYCYLTTSRGRVFIPIMILFNLGLLIATGNRGGFLVLVCGYLLFIYKFKAFIKVRRIVAMSLVGVLFIGLASVVISKYTEFNVLYDRLEATQVEGGVPDTRKRLWPTMFAEVWEESPLVGMGIRLLTPGNYADLAANGRASRAMAKQVRDYPHNLYLYIFYTLGFVGLFAYSTLFFFLLRGICRAEPGTTGSRFWDYLPRFGGFFLLLFVVDQLKVEFLRHNYIDYQNYITVMLGVFLIGAHIRSEAIKNGTTLEA